MQHVIKNLFNQDVFLEYQEDNIEDIIKLCNNNIGNKFLMPNKNLKVLIQNKKIQGWRK